MPDVIAEIAALLEHARPEVRAAAAIVLGELESKAPAAVAGLIALTGNEADGLAVAAIEALERIASMKALPALLAALTRSLAVATAAARAIAALGEAALPELRVRMKQADASLTARVSGVLAQIAGKKGLGALLDGFYTQDKDSVHRSAVMVRQEVRGASAKDKRALLAQLGKFLEARRTQDSEIATGAALKIVGYLEDPAAVDTLLAYVGKKPPTSVRIEALIGLRFALGARRDAPAVASALLPILGDPDPAVARTALATLGNLELPRAAIAVLAKAAAGDDAELSWGAIARLGALGDSAAAALVGLATRLPEARAHQAVDALGDSEPARAALLDAFLTAGSAAEAERLAHLLRPHARRLGEPARERLAAAARAHLKQGVEAAQAILALLREADPRRFASVLRDQATRAKPEAARALYGALCRTADCTDLDRYALARLELMRAKLPAGARWHDPAMTTLTDLARRGFPLADRLAAEKALGPEQLFAVGFSLAELAEGEGREVGLEILAEVAKGRSKLAKLAKNKIKIAGPPA